MHKFVRSLITEWRRLELPFSAEKLIVAVSGGADSTALLLALIDLQIRKKLTNELTVAHFNHNLRGKSSDTDERFVRQLAEDNGIEFLSGKGNLKGKSNLEQRARDERYAFLAKTAVETKAGFVLAAHTINDQAETFLLNLIRGSGVDGLRGMLSNRPLSEGSNVVLIRPLLRWAKREDTEQFCRDKGVKFCRDRMNDDLKFARVRIRKSVLPGLASMNPKVIDTLARTAELLGVAPDEPVVNTNGAADANLKLRNLKNLKREGLYTYIRLWLRERRGNLRGIELKHIEAVARLVKSQKSGRTVELPGGGQVVKGGGELAFRHIKLEY